MKSQAGPCHSLTSQTGLSVMCRVRIVQTEKRVFYLETMRLGWMTAASDGNKKAFLVDNFPFSGRQKVDFNLFLGI